MLIVYFISYVIKWFKMFTQQYLLNTNIIKQIKLIEKTRQKKNNYTLQWGFVIRCKI